MVRGTRAMTYTMTAMNGVVAMMAMTPPVLTALASRPLPRAPPFFAPLQCASKSLMALVPLVPVPFLEPGDAPACLAGTPMLWRRSARVSTIPVLCAEMGRREGEVPAADGELESMGTPRKRQTVRTIHVPAGRRPDRPFPRQESTGATDADIHLGRPTEDQF